MAIEHILVVDDEPGITNLCERLLRRSGYSVMSFNNPIKALEYLTQNKVDLLLVDIRMPEMDGFDVIMHTKQRQPDTAILVMTGFGTIETAIQALHQGVDGLLFKPFEKGTELLQAVKQSLENNQQKRDVARIQALRPLFDITETLLSETRPESLIDMIINAVCGYLRCNHSAYYQYSSQKRKFQKLASRGNTPSEKTDVKDIGIIVQVDKLGTPLWVNENESNDEIMQKQLTEIGLISIMSTPIVQHNIRGVLCAGRGAGEIPFREVEWEMFLLFSRQTAIALENAYLYNELRAYVRRVEESQQALVQAEKMAMVGRLTASIAHEINNPLQAVQNCLHLAEHGKMNAEKRKEYLNLANSELDRLMTTVEKMMDLYRPGKLEPKRVSVIDILRSVLKLLSPQLKERNVVVSTNYSPKLPRIMAVSNQIQQVFINLMLNAYDAMPMGGEIHIAAQLKKNAIEVYFQDTGPGIPKENRDRIFEPFVSTKKGGTGLGLSVSYGIITAHGGNLDLIHDRGSGACFLVSLPVKGEK